ncbi:hypothetical protein [Amycolatopsis sp. H20-H5]|uniref:hypothetical protein n=1 Tax=Amycolatopsis sp. H20-H5 TaxID=3046309 RepID=UPI002DB7A415|nr:hypothetical protein [Amycolatopsis sp. H20-H5]MEC3977170.1 hypothetical protein [Amycolatopsis sp. H20-H5]
MSDLSDLHDVVEQEREDLLGHIDELQHHRRVCLQAASAAQAAAQQARCNPEGAAAAAAAEEAASCLSQAAMFLTNAIMSLETTRTIAKDFIERKIVETLGALPGVTGRAQVEKLLALADGDGLLLERLLTHADSAEQVHEFLERAAAGQTDDVDRLLKQSVAADGPGAADFAREVRGVLDAVAALDLRHGNSSSGDPNSEQISQAANGRSESRQNPRSTERTPGSRLRKSQKPVKGSEFDHPKRSPTDKNSATVKEAYNKFTKEDLYAFGNKTKVSGPRADRDFGVESEDDIVGCDPAPKSPTDRVRGMSTFIDPRFAVDLKGHYHLLRANTKMPDGVAIQADGEDVGGRQPYGHRTLYPTREMKLSKFRELVSFLVQYSEDKQTEWDYVGKKPDPKKEK